MSVPFDDKQATARDWFDAYNARDIGGLCALSHPSIEIFPERPLMGPLVGTAFHERYPRIHAELATPPRQSGALIATDVTFTYDAEDVPPLRRAVWSLFDIDRQGVRRIKGYATEEQARTAARQSSTLTPREREVFGLLARGLTAVEIAEELVISPLTVRTHIQNAKDRLGARTRMEALTIALKRGEISA